MAVDPDTGMEYTDAPAAEAIPTAEGPAPAQSPAADNSGFGPVEAIPTDNSGAGPVLPLGSAPQGAGGQQPQGGPPKRFGPLGRIVSYLMGEGADNPAVLEQAATQADPSQSVSKSDANLLAVEQAAAKGGDQAAWKLVQANRVAYNAKQAFAYAALSGTQQKPPDVNAAVQAANQAAEHVLDGNNAKFMVSQGGQITATVTPPGGQPQIYDLTPDQFRRYLNVGSSGQWDKVMNGGVGATLQRLTAEPAPRSSPPMRQPPQAPLGDNDQREGTNYVAPQIDPDAGETNFGKTPSTLNLSGNTRKTTPEPDHTNYGLELEARAQKMFPGITQRAEAQRWMAQQEGTSIDRENKVEIAKNTNLTKERVAETGAGAKKEVAGIQGETAKAVAETKRKGWEYASDAKKAGIQITADQKAAAQGSKEAHDRIESARKTIATKRMTAGTLSPEDEALEKQLTAQGQQAGQRPQAQAPAPQQGTKAPVTVQSPADATKLAPGTIYMTPDGRKFTR